MLTRRSGKLVLGSGLSVWLWSLILHMMAPPLSAQGFIADARRIGLGAIGKGSTASKMIYDERSYSAIVIPFGLIQGMSRALLKLSGSLVHDYATISDDSPSPNRASRARRAATSAGIS